MLTGIPATVITDVIASGILTVLVAGVIVLVKRIPKELGQLTRDWYGEPKRPGFRAVPGIPERIQTVEDTLISMKVLVEGIDHEVHPNSGMSIKDAVHRTDDAVATLTESLNAHILVSEKWHAYVEKRLEEVQKKNATG